MKSSYKPISELVERIDIRNSDGDAAILMGLSIDKCFIHSVANTVGTDLTKLQGDLQKSVCCQFDAGQPRF